MADVTPDLHSCELDCSHGGIGALESFLQRGRAGTHGQHSPASGHNISAFGCGARVKDDRLRRQWLIQPLDGHAFFLIAG